MIHMTERPAFNSVKTKVEKSVGNIADLSSALDQVAVLGQLGGHGHVHKLVCNAHHHATNNSGVNSIGDESLLSRLEESTQGSLNLLLVGRIKLLGGVDNADNLAPVRCHQGAKRGHHGLGEAQPVVFSKSFKQVLAQVGNLESLANSSNSVQLQVVLDGGVKEERAKAGVGLHGG